MILLIVLSLIFMIIGIIFVVPALKCCTGACPPFALSSVRAKNIKWTWKTRDWFTPRGFKLYLWGTGFFAIGALLGVIYWSMGCFGCLKG
jgi:hypothetical protein